MKNYNYRDDKNYNYDNDYSRMRNYKCDFAILDSQKFNSYNDPYSNILFTDIKKVNEKQNNKSNNEINQSNYTNQVNNTNQVNDINKNDTKQLNENIGYDIKELIKRLILLDDNLIKLEKCKDCIIKNIFHVELLFDEAIIREKDDIYRKIMIDKLYIFKKIGNDIITSIKNNEDKFLNYSNELRNLIKDIFNLL